MPSVSYSFPVTAIPEKEIRAAMQETTRRIIPLLGYAKTTPRAVVYGPATLGGINMRDWHVEQGIAQLQAFLKHWRTDTIVSNQLKVALSWAQLQAGTGKSIMEDVETELPHLEAVWLPSLREFLKRVKCHLTLDDPLVPSLQRENDSYIMDHVLRSKQFKPGEITQINYCRMYLQAVTISDLTRAIGVDLDHQMLKGELGQWSSTMRYLHINQERPMASSSWTLWRRANKLWATDRKLDKPLGKWLYPAHKL
jgi:hypothetical protein